MNHIDLKDWGKHLELAKGDAVLISSGVKNMVRAEKQHHDNVDLNEFIDGMIEQVGEAGTVIFPTYNWGFCRGEPFDYFLTPSTTGALSEIALKRKDFKRTRHPIYSFAVCGKYQEELCSLNNRSAFGADSPFDFFRRKNVQNLIIDVILEHSFTYVHYVEETSGLVDYRYMKAFTADYTDENGERQERTYEMFVRKLELEVANTVDPIEPEFIARGAEKKYYINQSEIKKIYLGQSHEIILDDIKYNFSRKICTHTEQPKT